MTKGMFMTSSGWTERAQQRKFGFVMAGALTVISLLLYLRGSHAWVYTGGAAAFFLVTALAVPVVLIPLEWAWMKFALGLSFVMTRVLLTVIFFTGVTITGLVMRLLGKRPLDLEFPAKEDSCWREVDENGPCSRPDKPY